MTETEKAAKAYAQGYEEEVMAVAYVCFLAGAQWERERAEGLEFERDEYKRLAESWMKSYDELKEKYEPMETT